MLQYAVPPGYQRQQPTRKPKLGPWLGVIDAILEADKQRPSKQRHSAKRIFERLREEHGFTGGYTIVKDYVRSAELRSREMFISLTHAPGEAQVDFGEAPVVIAGVEQKAHYLAMDLQHSDDCFVAAFPTETTEAFLEGHVRAFAYFGGVPTRIRYDNTKIAVARILGGERRQRTRAFSELESYICLPISSGGRPRATIRARSRAWSAMHGGTSWFRSRACRAGKSRTRVWRPIAASGDFVGCAGTQRPSANASSVTMQLCSHCRRRPMRPARRSLAASVHCHWFASGRTTTLCPRSMGIARYGRRATCIAVSRMSICVGFWEISLGRKFGCQIFRRILAPEGTRSANGASLNLRFLRKRYKHRFHEFQFNVQH